MPDDIVIAVPLRRGQGGPVQAWTYVDVEDAPLVEGHSWSLTPQGYVRGWVDGRLELLHRGVLGLKPGDGWQADHIDRDRLNNTRGNLRRVTHRENGGNHSGWSNSSSRYRGVSRRKDTGRWEAYACIGGRYKGLGCFDDEKEAAAAARNYRLRHMPGAVD